MAENLAPVPPNGVVGVLGGGQLGRMLSMAAARLGLRAHIFCPEENCPARDVSAAHTIASYTDENSLKKFAAQVDVVTYEFENVPAETVSILEGLGVAVAPDKRALEIAQDRLKEKEFVIKLGGKTPLYHPVDGLESLSDGLKITGRPAILKTRHLGYDGKGQTRIDVTSNDLDQTWEQANIHAWEAVGARPSILEAFVPFEREISLIAARGRDGAIEIYDPPENIHKNGILSQSIVPQGLSDDVVVKARELTTKMLKTLDYVGVIGVEFFVMVSGDVLVNEFAPRVHNSGHWTEAACYTSQFEQHIRAVCGWPLGKSTRHSDFEMNNLIGDEAKAWKNHASTSIQILNLYGKKEIRPGRKMGHVTKLL